MTGNPLSFSFLSGFKTCIEDVLLLRALSLNAERVPMAISASGRHATDRALVNLVLADIEVVWQLVVHMEAFFVE